MSGRNINVCENSPSGSYGCFHCNLDIFNGIPSDSFKLTVPDETHLYDFEQLIKIIRKNNICFKILWDQSKFIPENNNINILKSIFKQNFTDYTTFFQFNDNVCFILTVNTPYTFQFHTRYKRFAQQSIYIILQYNCTDIIDLFRISLDKEKLSKQIVEDITPVLVDLHSNNYIHDDIKYDNFIFCNQKFKLIDYGEMKHTTDKGKMDNELTKLRNIREGILHAIEVKTSLPPPMSKPHSILTQTATTQNQGNMVTLSNQGFGNQGLAIKGESDPIKDTPPDVRVDIGTLPHQPRQSWGDWWRSKFRKGGKKYKSKKRLRKIYKNVQTFSKYKTVKIKKLKNNTKSNRTHYYKQRGNLN